jgi:tetratricopeptide (TPR) repeat protein
MENIANLEKKLIQCKNDDKEKASILNELSKAYLSNSPEKAIGYAEQALKLSEKISDNEEKAEALTNIGNPYQKLCDYNKALQYHLKALNVYELIPDKKRIAASYNNIGNLYQKLSNYDKALYYCLKSLGIMEESGNKKEIATALNIIGVIYWNLSSYDNALEYYLKSLIIKEEIGDKKGISASLNNIGLVYWNLNNNDKAIEYYLKSSKISEEIEDKNGISATLNNIGLVYWNLSNYDKALEYYLKSLKISEEVKDKKWIANTLNNIGIIYKNISNFDKALEYYLKSLNISEEIEDKDGIVRALINVARLFSKLKNFKKSLTFLERSLILAKEIKSKELLEDSYDAFTDLYTEKENYKKALEYYKLHSEVKETIFNEESSKKIAEMQTKYETETKEKEAEIYRLKNVELVKINMQLEKEIAERKKAEEAMEINKNRLKMVNSILRHDITNDFVVIRSALRMYKRNPEDAMLAEIETKVNKGLNTITRLREQEMFIESHSDLGEYSISDVLQETIANFPNIYFNIKGSGAVFADKALYSVFENIITNAVKHGKSPKIEILISATGKNCEIKIMDFGIGIPNEIKEKIFEEGFIYGETGHTGIGLYIVKQTIDGYGGTIFVEDNNPTGAIFVIILRSVIIEK